jgi:hypothetical protein
VAYSAILSRTVTVLKVAHNESGYIVLVDAKSFMVSERNRQTFAAAAGAMRLK